MLAGAVSVVAAAGCGGGLPSAGLVVGVYDGDTFTVESRGIRWRCRLLGVDALELAGRGGGGGGGARDVLRELMLGKRVELTYDSVRPPQDRWCRLLVYAEVAGVDVGAELVKRGLAAPLKRYPCDRLAEYERLQQVFHNSRRAR